MKVMKVIKGILYRTDSGWIVEDHDEVGKVYTYRLHPETYRKFSEILYLDEDVRLVVDFEVVDGFAKIIPHVLIT